MQRRVVVLALGLIACSADPQSPVDAAADARMDAGVDAGVDAGKDAGVDAGHDSRQDSTTGPDTAVDTGNDAAGRSVDECFAGLRAGNGGFQDATRASSDGAYRMRLALETGDRGSTSGTFPWAAFAFALTTPQGSVCITDASLLAQAYASSHHNCMDTLTVSSGGRRYVVRNPDSAASGRAATLTVFEGDAMVAGPIGLATVACNRGQCRSGGPCVGPTN